MSPMSLTLATIEPAVIEASRYLAGEYGDALKDPRLRMTLAAGQNYSLTTVAL